MWWVVIDKWKNGVSGYWHKKNALSTFDLKKKKKHKKQKKNINISIFKIEKNCMNPKFSCFFFFNLTTKHNLGLMTRLTCSKAIKSQRNFSTLPWYFFQGGTKNQVFSFADAVGNQEHPKNYGNGNGNYNYHLHLLLVFHVFLVDLAIEKREYFKCSRL